MAASHNARGGMPRQPERQNPKHFLRGRLWMDRFKSVMVEGKGDPLRKMAASSSPAVWR